MISKTPVSSLFSEALYNVALMYRRGQAGLPIDFAAARKFLVRAAAQKPYLRILVLGGVLVDNLGVAQAENR